MPPKPKFTKDKVLEAALHIVRTRGEDALTARNLAEELGSSTRPLYTLWNDMDEMKSELRKTLGIQSFIDFCDGYQDFKPAFKKFGIMEIKFATEEPNLFSFLFISPHDQNQSLEEWARTPIGDQACAIAMRDYDLDEDSARALFIECWLHAFSLGVLRVTGAAQMTDQEVSDSLSRTFMGMLFLAKTGRLLGHSVDPTMEGEPQGENPNEIDFSAVTL